MKSHGSCASWRIGRGETVIASVDYARYCRAVADEPLPLALVDLDAFDANLDLILESARGYRKRIRLATKSVRSVSLLRDYYSITPTSACGRRHSLPSRSSGDPVPVSLPVWVVAMWPAGRLALTSSRSPLYPQASRSPVSRRQVRYRHRSSCRRSSMMSSGSVIRSFFATPRAVSWLSGSMSIY